MKEKLTQLISEFFEIYAIDLRREKIEIPSYVQLFFGDESEYDDEGGYVTRKNLTNIGLFDHEKNMYPVDIEVEINDGYGWKEHICYALVDILLARFFISDLEKYSNQLIKVEKGT